MARQLLVSGQRGCIAVVEEDQVDVAGVVQLSGPELAHAQHREGRGLGLSAEGELTVALELEKDRVGKGAEATRGEVAQLAGDAIERPGAGDVGDGNG